VPLSWRDCLATNLTDQKNDASWGKFVIAVELQIGESLFTFNQAASVKLIDEHHGSTKQY
jgi:hypothetical protein